MYAFQTQANIFVGLCVCVHYLPVVCVVCLRARLCVSPFGRHTRMRSALLFRRADANSFTYICAPRRQVTKCQGANGGGYRARDFRSGSCLFPSRAFCRSSSAPLTLACRPSSGPIHFIHSTHNSGAVSIPSHSGVYAHTHTYTHM